MVGAATSATAVGQAVVRRTGSADTDAASAVAMVGAATSAAAPGEIMDSNVAPWITQFLKQLDAKLAAQREQLDARGAARREQPVQLERMKEQQTVKSTKDHKLQQEKIQQQSVSVTKLGRLAEISGQEALQQAAHGAEEASRATVGIITARRKAGSPEGANPLSNSSESIHYQTMQSLPQLLSHKNRPTRTQRPSFFRKEICFSLLLHICNTQL